MTVDADGYITDYNAMAKQLFAIDSGETRLLSDVLSRAEKIGLAPNLEAPIMALRREYGTNLLFHMRDARSILLSMTYSEADDTILELVDVSSVVATTQSAHLNGLTGLPNRSRLLERLQTDLAEATATGSGAVLLHIELHHFEAVNDRLGHPIGNSVLRLVASRLRKLTADCTLLVHLGGGEFAVLMTLGEQPQAAQILADRILDMMARTYLIQGHSIQLSASIGIAVPDAEESPDDILRHADIALFAAKTGGTGVSRLFTDDMERQNHERRQLEIDLRRAVAFQEFTLVYQPQFKIKGNVLIGFEALLRWTRLDGSSISPAVFVPIAEEIGLIVPLSEWVLRTACQTAAQWPEPLCISVNLSPLHFRSNNLIATITSALKNAGLAPERLELEITEGLRLDNTAALLDTVRQIKALGVRISMDDFGTGYSSLSYLQKFPFDKIKIDQSFVRSLETNPYSAAIVRAITTLATSLGIDTIAEGVETQAQMDRVESYGCQQVQGFLTGRPLAVEAADRLASNTCIRD